MKENIREYARIGITYHLLYPDCVHNSELHMATLPRVLDRDDIEVVDLCVPYGKDYRRRAIDLINKSNKTIIYNGYLLPLATFPFGTLSLTEREQVLILSKEQIDVAYEVGAKYFLVGTGPEIDPSRRKEAFRGLEISLSEICEYMAKKGNMGLLIELFDRDFAKKFLIGPSEEAVKFIGGLRKKGLPLSIELDVAHIPLMGETFKHAFFTCREFLKHVHVGNCVISDCLLVTHP